MARQRILRFPQGFLWGTASSSHQCEGNNTNNQWYRWEQQGHVFTGETSGAAANWWQSAESHFAQAAQNGFSDALDDRRPRAILEHLAMIHRAVREGIPVRGYLHWSLVDNFEWTDGWGVRFGLIQMNPLTQERIPRRSASLFGEICRANAITEDMVERYAPEAMDVVFGMLLS